MNRTNMVFVITGLTVSLSACGGKPTPVAMERVAPPERETPPPVIPATDDSAEREAEARRRAAEEERLRSTLAQMIHFDFDRYDIRSDARLVLDRKIDILKNNPVYTLRIEGHCDERGSDEYNLALGMRRANATKQYLVQRGLDPNRFEVVSYGEERPLDPLQTEVAWGKNRRAEFHITGSPVAMAK